MAASAALLWFISFVTIASDLGSQSVRGVVRDDSTGAPIQDAAVGIVDGRGREISRRVVRTDSGGRFIAFSGEAGRFRLKITRIGYQPLTSSEINLTMAGSVVDVDLRMTRAQTKLGTVVVRATTRLTRDELMSDIGYELRRAKGLGKFIDSVELSTFKTAPISFILEDQRGRFGLEFSRNAFGQDVIAMMASGGLICQPEVWIDGFEARGDRGNERLRALGSDMIYGVEIYGPRQLPLPSTGGEIGYSKMRGTMVRAGVSQGLKTADTLWRRSSVACGAIAVWTKVFVREMEAKRRGSSRLRVSPVLQRARSSLTTLAYSPNLRYDNTVSGAPCGCSHPLATNV